MCRVTSLWHVCDGRPFLLGNGFVSMVNGRFIKYFLVYWWSINGALLYRSIRCSQITYAKGSNTIYNSKNLPQGAPRILKMTWGRWNFLSLLERPPTPPTSQIWKCQAEKGNSKKKILHFYFIRMHEVCKSACNNLSDLHSLSQPRIILAAPIFWGTCEIETS